MAGIDHFAAEGSPHKLASSRAAKGQRKPRPLTDGALVRAALLGWLLAFLVGAGCLLAGEKGTVTGIVAGPSQAPIPGAKVTLAAADGSRQSVAADQSGHYSFASVEPGTYTLSAEAAGYQAATRTAVRVTGGTSTTVDLLLVAAAPPGPGQAPPVPPQPGYYDDTPLKASAVKTTIDAAGYSSQAQSPQRLMSEGPRLTGSVPKTRPREPGSPEAAQAERELQTAFRAHRDSFEANHQLGEFYLSEGDLKTGIPYLEKAQKLKPEDYANGYDLAVAYLETKNPGPARSLLQDMLRRKDAAELHNLLGEVDEARGDPISAVKEYQLAAHLDPNEKNLFDWGNELLLHETIEPAVEVFKRGVALYPNSQRMYIGLGIAYYSRSLYDGAIEALCHASDLNPSDPRPYLFLGKMYNVSVGKAHEVAKRMKRFMETNPDNAFACYYYALSSWKGTRGGAQGVDLAAVEALLRKSISLDPRLADAHLQLGVLLHDQRRDQEAIPEFQAAIRLKPDDPDPHYRLAQAYARTGNKERGQEEFQLYDKLHKQQVTETEKRRHEIQQFVFTADEPPKTNP
ncbi:MAG: tetratricopeptide repeat protein [Acidobacteriia bacterium]|nr:tetratricopeptide repeat protein [Terriglobia bacterium]